MGGNPVANLSLSSDVIWFEEGWVCLCPFRYIWVDKLSFHFVDADNIPMSAFFQQPVPISRADFELIVQSLSGDERVRVEYVGYGNAS